MFAAAAVERRVRARPPTLLSLSLPHIKNQRDIQHRPHSFDKFEINQDIADNLKKLVRFFFVVVCACVWSSIRVCSAQRADTHTHARTHR